MAQLYSECFKLTQDKEIKMILRRCKQDNKHLAQQLIHQVIQPYITLSSNDYSLQNKKIPVSKICSKLLNSEQTFIIKLDFTKYLEQFSIDDVLDILRQETKVHDSKLIKTIKHVLCRYEWKDLLLGKLLLEPLSL